MTTFARRLVVLTIAAALKRISVLKGKIKEQTERSKITVSFIDGPRVPDFDYVVVEAQLSLSKERLVTLQSAVAVANATTAVELGEGQRLLLAEAIRRAEEQKDEIARLKGLTIREGEEAKVEDVWDDDLGRSKRVPSKVVWRTRLSNIERHRRIEAMEQELEALNNAITATNHIHKVEWKEPIAAGDE